MLDRQVFIEYFTGFCEIFGKQPSEFIYSAYYEILKGYSTERVKKAMMACVKSHKYDSLPKPAQILQFLEISYGQRMLEQGKEVIRQMKQYEEESKQIEHKPSGRE